MQILCAFQCIHMLPRGASYGVRNCITLGQLQRKTLTRQQDLNEVRLNTTDALLNAYRIEIQADLQITKAAWF